MRVYPFPDKTASREELQRDLLYHKIPPAVHSTICDRAWDTGVCAAESLLAEYGGASIQEIAAAEGLAIKTVEKDNVAGNVRYFSEYYSGRKTIYLYKEAIKKWAGHNGCSWEEAERLILAHEMFHHLECSRLGETARQYSVPMLQIGSLRLGKSHIRALSEIGAHGFSHTFFRQSAQSGQKPAQPLQNLAVNDTQYAGKKMADKIFRDNFLLKILSGKGRKH
ncbi:MAG: hypothetical protein ACK5L3_08150 [Oscillospiraceae bacterium]